MNDPNHRLHRKRKSNSNTTSTNGVDGDRSDNMIHDDDNNNANKSNANNQSTKKILADSNDAIEFLSHVPSSSLRQEQPSVQPQPLPFLPLRQLRLEAIFYPKFENESKSQSQPATKPPARASPQQYSIRERMIQQCRSHTTSSNTAATAAISTTQRSTGAATNTVQRGGGGYIEVSVKHSGSLVLWSGDHRYYSKNSTNNLFTHTCEVLLRQHFYHYYQRCFCHTATNTEEDSGTVSIAEQATQLYNVCSQYIAQHRLTLSFEVVTAVLGDHGAHPIHDYIILTAIADRNRITTTTNTMNTETPHPNTDHMFYTTLEIVEFAQRFHLPHNDYWIYGNESSIQQLFYLYDTSRETGLTSTILPKLTQAATLNHNINHCHHHFTKKDVPSDHNNDVNDDVVEHISNTDNDNDDDSQYISNDECDYYIQSMYPHDIYQGEIVEGIVIRYVQIVSNSDENVTQTSTNTTDRIMEHIQRLSRNSRLIVQKFASTSPTDATTTTHISKNKKQSPSSTNIEEELSDKDPVFAMNLRTVYAETKAVYSKKGLDLFEERLRTALQQQHQSEHGTSNHDQLYSRIEVRRIPTTSDPISLTSSTTLSLSKQVPIWIETLLQQQKQQQGGSEDNNTANHPKPQQIIDIETYRIAKLIHDVSKISKNISYTIHEEKSYNDHVVQEAIPNNDVRTIPSIVSKSRYICIVHVLHDQTFHKYHKCKNASDLPLFRGFSFQLIGGENNDNTTLNDHDHTVNFQPITRIRNLMHSNGEIKSETLMLKMKFVPYMVRTFCCRNGLKLIRQADGVTAFTNFTNNLMSKWGILDDAKHKWRPFFIGWAQYAQPLLRATGSGGSTSCHQTNDEICGSPQLPPLSEYAYLDHLEFFSKMYHSGQYKVDECSSHFQGLVVIVAPVIDNSGIVADYVAKQLGGAKRRTGINEITTSMMEVACTPGQGIVCNGAIDKSYTTIRKRFLNDFEEFVSIVLVQCNDVSISESSDSATKEMIGYVKGWKLTRGARNVELLYKFDSKTQHDDDPPFQPSEQLNELISQLEEPIVKDSRPGLLVFFPTIPGSGKSSIVTNIYQEIGVHSNRNTYIDESDRLKGKKFWPHISKIRRRCYSGINIVDKNAPPSAWGSIGAICSSTQAVAVPVLPDQFALRTTQVKGIRRKDGTVDSTNIHIYPFSLPYLAVCMTRALLRPSGSHAGQLDQSNDRLCMIVIKFYTFYRHLSADQLRTTSLSAALGSAGAVVSPAPLEVPFFNHETQIKLHEDVESILLEALRCQFGYEKDKIDTASGKVSDVYLEDLEMRLRATLEQHQDDTLRMAADLSYTRQRFVQALRDKINDVDAMTSYQTSSFVQLAAIDIDRKSILYILQDLDQDERLVQFFETILQGNTWDSLCELRDSDGDDDENTLKELGFVVQTHVTLAHCREMSQLELRRIYTPYLESHVELSTNSIYFNDNVMALAVKHSVTDKIPTSTTNDGTVQRDTFVHVTVWCNSNVSAFEAMTLPQLVANNQAVRIDFPEHLFQGRISLWEK